MVVGLGPIWGREGKYRWRLHRFLGAAETPAWRRRPGSSWWLGAAPSLYSGRSGFQRRGSSRVVACPTGLHHIVLAGAVAPAVDDHAGLSNEVAAEEQGQPEAMNSAPCKHHGLLRDDGRGGHRLCRGYDASVAGPELLWGGVPGGEAAQAGGQDVVVGPFVAGDAGSGCVVDDAPAELPIVASVGGGVDVEHVHGMGLVADVTRRDSVRVVHLRFFWALGVGDTIFLLAARITPAGGPCGRRPKRCSSRCSSGAPWSGRGSSVRWRAWAGRVSRAPGP